ncbi:Dynein heavy chain [Trypanosoma brucei equiperdum]|uniref:Dynein heavy chain n=1 Tax=Trypanosoma brucei equiperdum TaxID=630700 RepID=A0A3L6L4I8_9TRYP|nr:Dynein heavy chain [Trypanosoma brucei equiperdum]
MNYRRDCGGQIRFEKVLAYFLDGIPRPFITVATDAGFGETFGFGSFGIAPDYTGRTEVLHFPEFKESDLFDAICSWKKASSSPSSRIGCHYSPYVGTFCYDGKRQYIQVSQLQSQRRSVRVPVGISEEALCTPGKSGRDFRTSLLIDLYENVAKGCITHETGCLRRIVILATQGTTADHRDVVERTMKEIEQVYIRVCVEAIYDYMNLNSLFRRIMAPLRLVCRNEDIKRFEEDNGRDDGSDHGGFLAFNDSLYCLKHSLIWSEGKNDFFVRLHHLWSDRFERLAVFNTTTFNWRTDADDFLSQLGCSMRAAFTRIRIEFYTEVEQLLFTTIPEAGTLLSMDLNDLKESELWRVFLMVRIFLTNRIRILISDAIDDLVSFFATGGDRIVTPLKARKMSLIEVYFVVGGCGLPSSPSFAQLHFGIADLLDELLDSANNLPTPETVIMRTIQFERHSLNLFDDDSFPGKATLIRYLGAACTVVEDLTEKYSMFARMPTLNGVCFTKCSEEEVVSNVNLLRETILEVGKISPDVVFCGCIAINCTDVKKWYVKQWSSYLKSFLNMVQKDILSFIRSSLEKCRSYNDQLSVIPNSVEELEKLQSDITYAEHLSKQIEAGDCRRAIEFFSYLEKLLIPADSQLYEVAAELMRCPNELIVLTNNAKKACAERKPALVVQLVEYRNDLHGKITVVRNGVIELLGLLSVDVCDICAQTCEELRVIVDDVVKGIDHVFYCERSLGLETVETFDDVHPVLRVFDVLEQFWCSVFDSTRVKDYYIIPLSALNSEKTIDEVQRCRRLLHSSVRNLRGYPGLVCLGRQQEQVLADFESLQTLLAYLSTPGLRKNHWKEIGRILQLGRKQSTQIDSNVTLKQLLENGIIDHLEEIKLIVDPAFLDFEAEATLERMKSDAKKTRFVFEVAEGSNDALILSPRCRTPISSQLEAFSHELSALRQVEHLSQYTISSVMEFDSVVQRMKETLLTWEDVEKEWKEVLPFGITLETTTDEDFIGLTPRDLKLLREKVSSTSDTFKSLAATLRKAQYTLFTAMMQENIQDQVTLARTILGDVRKILASSLDAKREVFPRFYLMDDESLLSFLSVHNATKLKRHLTTLYSRVCDVNLEGNVVTSFITTDGSVLRTDTPIELSPLPVEQWMKTFDRTLRSSLLNEIKMSVENHYRMDTLVWLGDSCVQVIDVALRTICHHDLREAVSVAGTAGMNAYTRRSKDVLEEYVRLADDTLGARVQRILSTAITSLLRYRDELRLVSKSGVETLEDLKATAMVQTLLEGGKIVVQMMGLQLPYGMEFFGDYNIPILTPEYVEKGLCSMLMSIRASSFPILIGKNNENSELEYYAQYLGRFCWFLQCHPTLPFEGIVRALRGCLGAGVILCLKDIELLGRELADSVSALLKGVESACRNEKRHNDGGMSTVEFQAGDNSICAIRDECFHVVLTTRELDEIPTALSLAFRPIYVPSVDLGLLAQGTLQALGVPHFASIGQRLATMFSQFVAMLPAVFTSRSFLSVIRDAADCKTGTMAESLCSAFLRQFWHVIESDERLLKLFEWNVVHTLGIPRHVLEEVLEKFKSKLGFDSCLERFTYFMKFNKNAMLVGSAYSGKTPLWKSWVGDTHYIVLSHRLLCSAEVYGDESRPGLLVSIARKWDPISTHTIVMEHTNVVDVPTFLESAAHVRVRSYSGPDFIQGSSTRIITVVTTLESANPRIVSEVAIYALPEPSGWKDLLKNELYSDPNCSPGAAFPVISALIEAVLDVSAVPRISSLDEDVFGVVCRCSRFYKRWYAFARSCGKAEGEHSSDDVFASQCAVFATCWSVMLCMQVSEISTGIVAFKKSQSGLTAVAQHIGVDENVIFPPDDDLLNYIATPFGWKKLGKEASDVGFPTPWASRDPGVNFKQHAWTYFFPLRSRQRTLMHLEYMAAVGQPVLLVGERGQGKSTLLNHMRCSSRWAYELVHNTVACTAGDVQDALLQGLSRSQHNTYVPSSGQRLVLCVDDVHLVGEMGYPQAMCVFAFIDHYSALCTPSKGYVPIKDVICVGTSLPTPPHEPEVENSVLRIMIPDFIEDEILHEVEKLIGKTRGVRRGEGFLKGVGDFLIASQSMAFHFINSLLGDNYSGLDRLKSTLASIDGICAFEDTSLLSFSDDRADNQSQLPYPYVLLRVVDKVLRILSTQLDEASIVKGIYHSVYTFFMPLIAGEGRREELMAELLKMAKETMRYSPGARQREGADETYVTEVLNSLEYPSVGHDVIRKWLEKHDVMMPPALVDEIRSESPYISTGKSRMESPSTKEAQQQAAVGGAPHVNCTPHWTVSLISDVHHCLRQEGSHVALVGAYGIGIRRALHVWAAGRGVNLRSLRSDFVAPDAKNSFTRELIEILQGTCRSGSRMVVFVPNEVLTLVWPLSLLYYTLRGGNVRQLFSVEEQLYLLHGRRGIQRQSGKLTPAEEVQLRERISSRLSIVAHFVSFEEMRRLGTVIPFVLQMLPVVLHAPDMLREHVDVVIRSEKATFVVPETGRAESADVPPGGEGRGKDAPVESIPCFLGVPMDTETLLGRPYSQLLCDIFFCLRTNTEISVEQLQEFATLANRLRGTLFRICHCVSQSLRVDDLFNAIPTKMQEYINKSKEAEETKVTVVQHRGELVARLERSKECATRHQSEWEFLQRKSCDLLPLVTAAENALRLKRESISDGLSSTKARLCSMKTAQIRQYASSLPSPKGVLLVKAVCRVLGEDLRATSTRDVWDRGRSIMTASKFIARLRDLDHESLSYESLASVHSSLRGVRFTDVSPFADALSDYLLSVMEAVRVKKELQIEQMELDSLRLEYTTIEDRKNEAGCGVSESRRKIECVEQEVNNVDEKSQGLETTVVDMTKRQKSLEFITDALDRFSLFHTPGKTAAQCNEMAKGEGAVIMVAAHFAFFASLPLEVQRSCHKALYSLLCDWGIQAPADLEDPAASLLFPSVDETVESLLLSACSAYERQCIAGLLQKIFSNCPIFCGVTNVFEEVLGRCLAFICGDCVVVSVMQKDFCDEVVRAASSGIGLLICDVHAPSVLERLRPLLLLLKALPQAALQKRNLRCTLFGQEVPVKPSFLMVCVSPAVMLHEEAKAATRCYTTVVNIPSPRRIEEGVHTILLGCPTAYARPLVENVFSVRDKQDNDALCAFRVTLPEVREMLSGDLDELAGNNNGELERLDFLLRELHTLHMTVLRIEAHNKSVQKPLASLWEGLKRGIQAAERAVRVIEKEILGRLWEWRMLEPFIVGATNLSSAYVRRISPGTFDKLPPPQRDFYATVNFVESLVDVMASGWPMELRGIFAWYILSTVVHSCGFMLAHSGVLYSSHITFLTSQQYDVLNRLLTRQNIAADKQTVRNLYESSMDPLLNSIARDNSTLDDTESGLSLESTLFVKDTNTSWVLKAGEELIRFLFQQWMLLNHRACDAVASDLYAAFFTSVKKKVTEEGGLSIYDSLDSQCTNLRYSEEWWQFSGNTSIPLLLKGANTHELVGYVRQRANSASFFFRYLTVTNVRDLDQLVGYVSHSFQQPPTHVVRGHCVMAVFVPPAGVSEEASFLQAISSRFSALWRYGIWGLLRGGGHSTRTPVVLCCTVRGAPNMVRNNVVRAMQEWCFPVVVDSVSPRHQLLSVIGGKVFAPPWKREGVTLLLERECTKSGVSCSHLDSCKRGDRGNTMVTPLGYVLELHAGISAGGAVQRALVEDRGLDNVFTDLYRTDINTDDLLLILRLVSLKQLDDPQEEEPSSKRHPSTTLHAATHTVSSTELKSATLQRRSISERLYRLFNKVAYLVYTSRSERHQGCLLIENMLYERGPLLMLRDDGRLCYSTALDELLREKPTDEVFMATLRRSDKSFLHLCGDDHTIVTYRSMASSALRRSLCGVPFSTRADPLFSTSDGPLCSQGGVDGASQTEPHEDFESNSAVSLLLVWEGVYGEKTVRALERAQHKELSSRLRVATAQFRGWQPGSVLSVWLPALQYPKLLLNILLADALERKGDLLSHIEAVLVVTRRYMLLHDDVLLVGAAPSRQLEREVSIQAGWKPCEMRWNKEVGASKHDMDIVIAVRYQSDFTDCASRQPSGVLWDLRSGKKGSEPRQEGSAMCNSVLFLTEPEPPQVCDVVKRSVATVPVVGLDLQWAVSHPLNPDDKPDEATSRVWQPLFELPLYVTVPACERSELNATPPRSVGQRPPGGRGGGRKALASSGPVVDTLGDSLGFFIAVS